MDVDEKTGFAGPLIRPTGTSLGEPRVSPVLRTPAPEKRQSQGRGISSFRRVYLAGRHPTSTRIFPGAVQ